MSEDSDIIKPDSLITIPPTIDILSINELSTNPALQPMTMMGEYLSPNNPRSPFPGNHVIFANEWDMEMKKQLDQFVFIMEQEETSDYITHNYKRFLKINRAYVNRLGKHHSNSEFMQDESRRHEEIHRMQEIRFGSSNNLLDANAILYNYSPEEITENKKLSDLLSTGIKLSTLQEAQAYYASFTSTREDFASKKMSVVLFCSDLSLLFVKAEDNSDMLTNLLSSLSEGKYFNSETGEMVLPNLVAKTILLLKDKDDMQTVFSGNFDVDYIKHKVVDGFKSFVDSPGQFVKSLREADLTKTIDTMLMQTNEQLKQQVESSQQEKPH